MVFWLEGIAVIRLAFGQWQWREITAIYALLIVASVVIFSIWKLAGKVEDGYLITRFLMGLAQSPVPLMLVVPALFLRKRIGFNQETID